MFGLYVHIPFCSSKCSYCDFNSQAGLSHLHSGYVRAVIKELSLRAETYSGRSISTVYVGGGTPTVLTDEGLVHLLEELRRHLDVAPDAEITVEANPDSFDRKCAESLREAGVNRLSLGFQSVDDSELAILGRRHSAERAMESFRVARNAGFDNINIDLILGVPFHDRADRAAKRWKSNLETVLSLGPEHISCYALELKEDSGLADRIAGGAVRALTEDEQADMMIYAMDALSRAGYIHYEISNFAKPSFECRHNLIYWTSNDYVGLGAGAHSKTGRVRRVNHTGPGAYIEAVENGDPVREIMRLTEAEYSSEMLFMGLRLTEGIKLSDFQERFGWDLLEKYGAEIKNFSAAGLVHCDSNLRLTRKGILLANEVWSTFV